MASIDLDCIPLNCQFSDLNNSSPTDVPVNVEPQPAPELNGTQIATQGKSYFAQHEWMIISKSRYFERTRYDQWSKRRPRKP